MKLTKQDTRLRRARRGRVKIKELAALRLSVHRTPQHIYAQILDPQSKVLATASTVQKTVRADLKGTGNATAAAVVGKAIAEAAKAAGIVEVAFDRSGFKYHGRIKALADAALEADQALAGLEAPMHRMVKYLAKRLDDEAEPSARPALVQQQVQR